MDENMEKQPVEAAAEEESSYIPRPAWQVWGARIALVLFILLIVLYYINVSRGGF